MTACDIISAVLDGIEGPADGWPMDPVDSRTTNSEMLAEAIRQRDEARTEIETLRRHHEGLKKKHAEVIAQWVKETNERRQTTPDVLRRIGP